MGLKLPPDLERKCLELARQPTAEPAPAADISEKDFMADVVALAKRLGWRVYHTTDSRKSAAGFPDLVMVRSGRLIFAELKTADGKVTADQQRWLEDLGFLPPYCPAVMVHLWRPADWPQIVETLT